MKLKLDAELYYGLLWMKDNWMRNDWNDPAHHYAKIWPSICNFVDGNVVEGELNELLAWTHPRGELGVNMTTPPDIVDKNGWGPLIKVSEIHELLLQLRRDLASIPKE